ncbi:MAG: hypothetical protein E3J64_10195, partial [Anaerolineales bacterium]
MTPKQIIRYLAVRRRQRRRAQAWRGPRGGMRVVGIILMAILFSLGGLGVAGVSGVLGALAFFTEDLPDPEEIENADRSFETTKIYDRTGQIVLQELIDPLGGDRSWVTLEQMPDHFVCGTVAFEDKSFWTNVGFDLSGMARALWGNLQGQETQGGSSITQQLVKNVVIEEERRYVAASGPDWEDYERKITEVLLSYRITQRYSKEQILEWYLNTNFYGNLAYGIEAAALVYFGKPASELTLSESATLIAIPQYPQRNPFDDAESARKRQHIVLDTMVTNGCIDADDAAVAKYEPWDLARLQERYDIQAPHFSNYVRQVLESMPEIGADALYRGGLRVYTTIDMDLQAQAECLAQTHVRRLSGENDTTVVEEAIANGCSAAEYLLPLRAYHVGLDHNVSNAAVVVIRPSTGELLSMVGSVDYWDESIDGQFNVAVDGNGRQPGSSFKPFTYVTLLSQGYNAAHMFLDVRTAFWQVTGVPYVPENYDRKYHGPQRLRLALARSYNIPAVQALQLAGVDNTLRTAHRMGITTLDQGFDYYGLSLTLGGGEVHLLDMTYAFSVFANNGSMYGAPVPEQEMRDGFRELDPVAILRIEDRDGNVLYEYTQPESRQILAPELAYLMNNILSDEQSRWAAFGYPNSLELPGDRPAAAKTGTTNDYRDAWTVGYTPQLAAGVWVGNSDNAEMELVAGSTGAAPIWRALMEYALHDEDIAPFLRPGGLVEFEVCAVSGHLPTEHCPTVTELFVPGTEPTEECRVHQSFLVNRETGLLCTVHTPPHLCEERVYEVYPPQAADWLDGLSEESRPPTPPTEYDTIWGWSPTNADVAIIDPLPYSYVRGVVPVMGNAKGSSMNFFRLRFGEGLYPTEWVQIGPDHGNWVDHNLL